MHPAKNEVDHFCQTVPC